MGTMIRGERRTARKPRLRHLFPVIVTGLVLIGLPRLGLGHSTLLAVLQALLPVICIPALVPCLYLAIRRAWVSAVVLALSVVLARAPTFNPAAAGCIADETIPVLSLNAGRGLAGPAGRAVAITQSDAEVLVLVEASEPMISAVSEALPQWTFTNRTGPVVAGGERLTP